MTGKFFIDSNIWLYLFLPQDERKKAVSKAFLDNRVGTGTLFVSWQVVNEVWSNLLRNGIGEDVACGMAEYVMRSCTTVDLSRGLLMSAHDLRLRDTLHFWDSLVIAAALEAECGTLVSEDMQDGKRFGRMVVRNIFGTA